MKRISLPVAFGFFFAAFLVAPSGRPASPASTPVALEDSRDASKRESLRRESLHEQNSLYGATGTLRLESPGSGAVGTLRLALLLDTFRASNFLCNSETPCDGETSDSAGAFGSTLSLSLTPLSFLEAYATLHSRVSSDDARTPSLIAVVGNTTIGAKLFVPQPVAGFLHFGGSTGLSFLAGTGDVGISFESTSLRLSALAEGRFDEIEGISLPLRARVNLSYLWDNSGHLVDDVEQERGAPVSRIERFALDLNRVDQVQTGLGVDAPLGIARPFVEWTVGIPVNRQGYVCNRAELYSGDQCLAADARFAAIPSKLTLGSRFYPFLEGLSATLALDIGTSGTSAFLEELAPTRPWDLWLGLGYAVDTTPPSPAKRIVERTVEKPIVTPKEAEFHARGLVHESGKTEGIANAIVRYQGRDLTGMVTGPDGRFMSGALPPGTYTLDIEAEGYQPTQCSVTLQSDSSGPGAVGDGPRYVDVDCAIVALPPFSNLSGTAYDATSMKPLAAATVKLRDRLGRELELSADESGSFRFERILPGEATLSVQMQGYLAHTETLRIEPRTEPKVVLLVRGRPKVPRVRVTATELALTRAIQFEGNSATLAAASVDLLEEVADALANAPQISRVEVEGHVDASGDRDQALSEERANAVREWLGAHGVDHSRLSARGYGSTRPISPNITPAGRSRNRRIRFEIVDGSRSSPR